jgi:2,3-bisphosphoglycerate-dependent phosphoglycerate mutase
VRLIIVRHAQTVWNASGKIQGQADPPLSESGRAQCQAVAERLATASIQAIFSSDLVRARETAAAIALRHPGLEARLDPDLREIDLGEWEGADRKSLKRSWPDLYAAWRVRPSWDLVPGGEASAAFKARVMGAVGRAAAAVAPDETVAVVTHIGVVRTLLSTMVGAAAGELRWPWAIDNTGVTVVEGSPDVSLWNTAALEIVAINDNSHLAQASQAGV